jgi:uncharacterized protein (DUF1499 family)
MVAAAYGYRLEMWDHRITFKIITWSVYAGVAAGALSIVGLFLGRGGKMLAVAGIILSAIIIAVPYGYDKLLSPKAHPRIHDITTDTVNPPAFVAVVAKRDEARKQNPNRVKNKIAYGGAKVAALQKKHHPDLKTIVYKHPPDKVFNATLDLAGKMGWDVVAAVPAEGRIEATASTFWLGFKDDVVFRIKPSGPATAWDMRSASRFGRGDRGENARRIKAFIIQLNDKLR